MDGLLASRQSLQEAMRSRSLVPVVGPDAILVEGLPDTAGCVPFYRRVVEELLRTYQTQLPVSAGDATDPWLLHRAVGQVLGEHREISTERVRRSVSAIVKSLATQVTAAPLLDRLARLGGFDLLVCLTPDDLLVDALQRAVGSAAVEVASYAPNADSSQAVDVSPARPGLARVYFPLGRSAAGSRVAIHEEDAFEHLYKFQEESARRAPNLLTALRSRDLLLLGCSLPDWLGRSFLRLANENRLSSQDKKMEFFAADARDPVLNAFLARFDPNATVFPWSAEEFVAELEALVATSGGAPPPPPPPPPGTAQGPTMFVSYASQDTEAARRLADALLTAGFADVWLDKRKLIAGDDWSDRIDTAIEHCDFFMPVLSHQADGRREGVYWEEWRKAIVRALRVNDAFMLPAGIDETPPDRSGYGRIFNGFTADLRRLHLIHAPQGQLSPATTAELQQLCVRFRGGGGG